VEVDFTGLEVFVVCGQTGAGKTTLIDAICYALYGKVPRGTNTSDLISHESDAMKVQLEFEASGRTYRVHRGINRRLTRSRKTGESRETRDISPVQFEELVGADWVPVEGRVRDVNAAIEARVGLDFDGFTKCVLLPQGRFQEFLAGDKEERRKILIDLLELGIYDRVKGLANARGARLKTQADGIERQLGEDYAEATEEALAAVRARRAAAEPALVDARGQREALQAAHADAKAAAEAYQAEKQAEAQLAERRAELQAAEKAAEGATKRLEALIAAEQQAQAALAASTYDARRGEALVAARARAKVADEARARAEDAARAAADRSAVEQAERAAAHAEAALAEAKQRTADAHAALDAANREDAAAHVRSGLKPGDQCPVCGGVVGTLPKAQKSQVATAKRALDDAVSAEAKASDAATRAAQARARAQQAVESAEQQARAAAEALARAEGDLREALPEGVPAESAAIARLLEEQQQAAAAHQALGDALERARTDLQAQRESMAGSEAEIAALRGRIAQLESSAAESQARRKDASAKLKRLAGEWQWPEVVARIEANKSPVDQLAALLDAAQRETERLTAEIARLEQDEQRIAAGIERAAELRAELQALAGERELCETLGRLLRADAFTRFVLEEAMQVLAETATAHLARLYDRLAIQAEGDEFYVIDHWHADQRRPARTLSGGETFVASLALALALSERLPELRSAAQTKLESLFLDEGFGTLDEATLGDVVEALEGLRSQERMVGIVTHVPELAQRIESRIEVMKSPSGSTLAVTS